MYRAEQWKVLEALGREIPKRPTSSVADIVEAEFKRKDNADRVVRNALRKPRAEGHVEIADRGEYRLTQKGASFLAAAKKEGYKPDPPRKSSKKVAKKAAKKGSKKKTAKKAAAKKATKKVAKKRAASKKTPSTKKVSKKASTKRSTKSRSSGNGDPTKNHKPKTPRAATGATLSF